MKKKLKIQILAVNKGMLTKENINLYGISTDIRLLNSQQALCRFVDTDDDTVKAFSTLVNNQSNAIQILNNVDTDITFLVDIIGFEKFLKTRMLSQNDHFDQVIVELDRRIKNRLNGMQNFDDVYGLKFDTAKIMGILNVTPDSFSDGGKYLNIRTAVDRALMMEEEGADIIDIGGESSRPGADPVSINEELSRIIPVIKAIRRQSKIPISVDTCKSEVARQALDIGVDWINDISGLRTDPVMIEIVREYNCPVIVMHMKGTPKTMQIEPKYEKVCLEINDFFEERIKLLNRAGIDKIVLDPGLGFGKQVDDNLDLMKCGDFFSQHGYPILIGVSRKSFLGNITNTEIADREAGTIASQVLSILKGAQIIRVHDVKACKDAIMVINAMSN